MSERATLTSNGLTLFGGNMVVPISELVKGVIARSGNTVIVSGTLVEGIGNEFSDIDVHVLCERLPKASEFDLSEHHRLLTRDRAIVRVGNVAALNDEVFIVHSAIEGTGIKIDVEYDTYESLDETLRQVNSIFEYAVFNPILLTKSIAEREKWIFHRAETGISMTGNIKGKIDCEIREKFRYLLYRWAASDFRMLIDCLGAFKKEEMLRAAAIARDWLIQEAGAFVALLGGLNTRRKWVPTYLQQLYTGDSGVVDEFLRLYSGVSSQPETALSQYVIDVVKLIDLFFDEGRELLGRFSGIPVGEDAVRMLELDRNQCAFGSIYSDMEFEYRSRAYVDKGTSTVNWFVC
ncbi:hypothetical protein [Acidisoma sp. 7E03]